MSVLGFTKKNIDDVEPRCPILHDYKLLTDAYTYDEIQTHLWFLRASYECYRPTDHDDGKLSPWLFITRPIAFVNGDDKKNLKGVPEMHKFRCFSEFFAEKFEWQTIRMGVFCSKETWVGNPKKWSDIPFRCWAAILYPKGEHFRLLIIDPNAFDTNSNRLIHHQDLPDMQQKFIGFCNEKKNIELEDVRVMGHKGGNRVGNNLSFLCGTLRSLLDDWRNWWPLKRDWLKECTLKVNLSDEEKGSIALEDQDKQAVPDGLGPLVSSGVKEMSAPASNSRKRRGSKSSGISHDSRSGKRPPLMMYFNDEEREYAKKARQKSKARGKGSREAEFDPRNQTGYAQRVKSLN